MRLQGRDAPVSLARDGQSFPVEGEAKSRKWESSHSIPVGGLAAHVTELAETLHVLGHDVHIFTRMGPGQLRYDWINGVHYHRCPFDPNADFLPYVGRMCNAFVARLSAAEVSTGGPSTSCTITTGSHPVPSRVKHELQRPSVLTIHRPNTAAAATNSATACRGRSGRSSSRASISPIA